MQKFVVDLDRKQETRVDLSNDEIEARQNDIQAKSLSANNYINKRQAEYPSLNYLIVALWEQVIENNPTSAQNLEAKRQNIKTKYPKPAPQGTSNA